MSFEEKTLSVISDEELARLYILVDEITAWMTPESDLEVFREAVELEVCRRFCKLSSEQHFYYE